AGGLKPVRGRISTSRRHRNRVSSPRWRSHFGLAKRVPAIMDWVRGNRRPVGEAQRPRTGAWPSRQLPREQTRRVIHENRRWQNRARSIDFKTPMIHAAIILGLSRADAPAAGAPRDGRAKNRSPRTVQADRPIPGNRGGIRIKWRFALGEGVALGASGRVL